MLCDLFSLTETVPTSYYSVQPRSDGIIEVRGVVEWRDIIRCVSDGKVIVVNGKDRQLVRVNEDDVSGIEHGKVLDLSDNGERWEGDVLNNEPYGWGVLYDSENRMAYEGFRIGEVNVCYGTLYYSDIQKVEYKGMICEGKRWGRGVQYNREGKVMFDGEWMEGEQMEKEVMVMIDDKALLHNHLEVLHVSSSCCNEREWRMIDFSVMPNLRELKVEDDCFENVEEVRVIGMKKLESVVIGENCFAKRDSDWVYDPSHRFYLKDCDKLSKLKIGSGSFHFYSMCEIINSKSLNTIELGNGNDGTSAFYYSSLTLKSGVHLFLLTHRFAGIGFAFLRYARLF